MTMGGTLGHWVFIPQLVFITMVFIHYTIGHWVMVTSVELHDHWGPHPLVFQSFQVHRSAVDP